MSLESHIEKLQKLHDLESDILDSIDNCFDLNAWECDFLTSIHQQVQIGRTLTGSQMSKFKDIQYKIENGGEDWDR